MRNSWRNALRNAGITRKIRPYDLRHAFATMLIASGTDVGTVAALMGHTTPTMVLTHYQHVLTKQKKLAVSTLQVFSCAQVRQETEKTSETRINIGGEEEI